jgi:hypothetical protein
MIEKPSTYVRRFCALLGEVPFQFVCVGLLALLLYG